MYRGQIVALDLILTMTIALAIVFIINSQWGIMLKNVDNYETQTAAENAASTASLCLIESQGYPQDWNSSTVQVIGIAKDLDTIDPAKFNEMMKIGNGSLGELLGIPEFKVYVNLTTKDGITINATGLRPLNYSTAASILSFASFNKNFSKLYVTVWK